MLKQIFFQAKICWDSFVNAFSRSLENLLTVDAHPANVRLGSAMNLPVEWAGQFDAIICDPPYYDSVTYADLTDFFYPWHKRVIGDDYPEAFVTEVTPKTKSWFRKPSITGAAKPAPSSSMKMGWQRRSARCSGAAPRWHCCHHVCT
jgi:hypothetical protein